METPQCSECRHIHEAVPAHCNARLWFPCLRPRLPVSTFVTYHALRSLLGAPARAFFRGRWTRRGQHRHWHRSGDDFLLRWGVQERARGDHPERPQFSGDHRGAATESRKSSSLLSIALISAVLFSQSSIIKEFSVPSEPKDAKDTVDDDEKKNDEIV